MASIVGRVLSTRRGPPIAREGLAVTVLQSSQPHFDLAAVTDEDGTFVFHGLAPGRYLLGVGDKQVEVLLDEGAERVSIEVTVEV